MILEVQTVKGANGYHWIAKTKEAPRRIVAESSEVYYTRADAVNAARLACESMAAFFAEQAGTEFDVPWEESQ